MGDSESGNGLPPQVYRVQSSGDDPPDYSGEKLKGLYREGINSISFIKKHKNSLNC